jgi:hypothetical protein
MFIVLPDRHIPTSFKFSLFKLPLNLVAENLLLSFTARHQLKLLRIQHLEDFVILQITFRGCESLWQSFEY